MTFLFSPALEKGKNGQFCQPGLFSTSKNPWGKMEPRKERSSLLQGCNVQEGDRERQGTSSALEGPKRTNISLVCLGY